jgi:hypothetical protein
VYETSVDVAVASLNAAVRDAMEQAILRGYNHKFELPPRFSNSLRYCVVKKNFFRHRFK